MLLSLVGCLHVTAEVVETQLVPSDRPILGAFVTFPSEHRLVCEEASADGAAPEPVDLAAVLSHLQGAHAGLVRVTIQQREEVRWVGRWPTGRRTCFAVTGVPFDPAPTGEVLAAAEPPPIREPRIPERLALPEGPRLVPGVDALVGWGDVRWGEPAPDGPGPDGSLFGLMLVDVTRLAPNGRLVGIDARLTAPEPLAALIGRLGPPTEPPATWRGAAAEVTLDGDRVSVRPASGR